MKKLVLNKGDSSEIVAEVKEFRGRKYLDIRTHTQFNGEMVPTKKGVTLSLNSEREEEETVSFLDKLSDMVAKKTVTKKSEDSEDVEWYLRNSADHDETYGEFESEEEAKRALKKLKKKEPEDWHNWKVVSSAIKKKKRKAKKVTAEKPSKVKTRNTKSKTR